MGDSQEGGEEGAGDELAYDGTELGTEEEDAERDVVGVREVVKAETMGEEYSKEMNSGRGERAEIVRRTGRRSGVTWMPSL